MTDLPPLPRIEGDIDLMLDVYTHSSLYNALPPMKDDYGDTQRLAELGAKVLDLAVTYHYYSKKPFMSVEEIQRSRADTLSDQCIELWLTSYGLKTKLRVPPDDSARILNDPQEMRKYFNTYIGALYIRNGLGIIQSWISGLIDPGTQTQVNIAENVRPPQGHHQMPAQQFQSYYSSPYHGYSPSPKQTGGTLFAPPPQGSPPPLPSSPPSGAYSGSMNLITLALVNQTASQKGLQVSYPAEQEGPPHQPIWTVRCLMNGNERGRGVGKSQKIAKEEAARQAWASMGW